MTKGLSDDDATAAHCLKLPGKTLYLTPLLAQKKFRKWGNKEGAIRAFYQLEAEGLGTTLEVGGSKGTALVWSACHFVHMISIGALLQQWTIGTQYTSFYFQQYEFEKATIPEDMEEKTEFVKKLARYIVSLVQYARILQQKEIKP